MSARIEAAAESMTCIRYLLGISFEHVMTWTHAGRSTEVLQPYMLSEYRSPWIHPLRASRKSRWEGQRKHNLVQAPSG